MLTNAFEAILGLFLAVAVFKLFLSLIRSAGLLTGRRGSRVQLERLPLFLLVWVGAAVYAILAFGNLRADNPVFPRVPNILLWLVAASQLLYVVGKYLRSRQWR